MNDTLGPFNFDIDPMVSSAFLKSLDPPNFTSVIPAQLYIKTNFVKTKLITSDVVNSVISESINSNINHTIVSNLYLENWDEHIGREQMDYSNTDGTINAVTAYDELTYVLQTNELPTTLSCYIIETLDKDDNNGVLNNWFLSLNISGTVLEPCSGIISATISAFNTIDNNPILIADPYTISAEYNFFNEEIPTDSIGFTALSSGDTEIKLYLTGFTDTDKDNALDWDINLKDVIEEFEIKVAVPENPKEFTLVSGLETTYILKKGETIKFKHTNPNYEPYHDVIRNNC